jgi:hypothetical protein
MVFKDTGVNKVTKSMSTERKAKSRLSPGSHYIKRSKA